MSEIEVNRGFTGVFIPKALWINTELTWMEKLFLAEIEALDNDDGCFASNAHFEKFFGLGKRRTQEIISSIKNKGFIESELIKQNKAIVKRIIKVTEKYKNPNKNKVDDGCRKVHEGWCGKVHEGDAGKCTGRLLIENINNRTTSCLNSHSNDKSKKKEFSNDSQEIALAGLLLEKLLERNPTMRKPNIQSWAKHIDLMHRIDKRSFEDIRKILLWSQNDDFWQDNILSTHRLREQYDQLFLKAKKKAKLSPKEKDSASYFKSKLPNSGTVL